ncbi:MULTISPECIES: OmpA family protein [Thiomicrorhabdus]|uniref:OmpA family protein n=1 Tax=Thiomicrorhabdus heinhorstiae TaxID=2748010 RepID=A0ABS0BTS1_9GAMM|nr:MULTISPECIES: OmpA family protein [Thiomicrorhabdus]MBF6057236.1 OmpA family protein [Thiomicrorhabdus heinhorstiae]
MTRNTLLAAILATTATLNLTGCGTAQTKEEQETEKNVITAVAAIGGALAANALGMDSNAGKAVVGVIAGVTARKVYEEVNQDTANDPNTDVEAVKINGQEYIQVNVKDVNFRKGSAQLDPEELNRLVPVLNTLKKHPNTRVHIEGHTDSDGSEAYNQQLSENRAKNVAMYLINNGISSSRIVTYGYGESRPIASNATAEGKRMNRRVTFLISEI